MKRQMTTEEFIVTVAIGAFLAGCCGVLLADLMGLLNEPHATIQRVS